MRYKVLLFNIIGLITINKLNADKITQEGIENYSAFFNFGDKKLSKLDKDDYLENSIIKSKVDVLGEVFKKNIDALKVCNKLDLVFLIDASSSVGELNFRSELGFVKKLLSDVIVDIDHSRIAVVTFSSKNNVIKTIDEITVPKKENNKCLLLNKELNNVKYIGGGTYTVGAFQVAKDIFFNSRNESRKVLFLITDGYSNGGDPVPLANELKKNRVTIFTIGIRNGNYKELYELSTSPGEFYSYLLDSFQEFENLARRALHVDIKSGDYVPLGTDTPCDILCETGNCCDKNALCTCSTSTGHYTCLCQPGYYGSGLQNSCSPCPSGTYSDGPNLCLPCPDIHHVTIPPANGIHSCECKRGYRPTKNHRCEIIKCENLLPPEHGYFVKKKDCGNTLNNACGVRCEVGYTLIGSSIRLCQSNGNWSGDAPSCQVKTCSALIAPLHGSISCVHDDLGITYNNSEKNLPIDTTCTSTCDGGRTLVGSSKRTCLPLAQWDGLKSSCKSIKCNKLSNIPFGKIEPKSCTMGKQAFGKLCKYSCQDGFKLLGPEERSCTGKRGTWSNKSVKTNCQDITPPTLVCPEKIKANTVPGQNYGIVSWNIPNVTDNSGLNVTMWLKPAIKNVTEFRFKLGKTKVTYFAQDTSRNIAKCNFTVEIKDVEPPTIESCVDPPIYLSMDSFGANITWEEPIIFDNSENFTVTKTHEFGFFKMGLTQVTYVVKDSANNINTCTLNITVQESHCEPLPDPIFGRSECTSLSNGIQCIVTCQEGYAIPIASSTSLLHTIDVDDSSTQFICDHSDPIWYSEQNTLFPDCTITEIPTEILQKGLVTIQSEIVDDICNNETFLNELENDIRNDLHYNLQNTCSDAGCNINTTSVCENKEISEYEERTNIIKREAVHAVKKNKKKKKKINVTFEIKAVVPKNKFDNTLKSLNNIQQVQFLKNNNITRVTEIRVEVVNIVCPRGFVQRKKKCVQCPKGTFHNTVKGMCQSCPLGFYNDKTGQTSCIICPINHSTERMRSKSLNNCKSFCPPGTYARRKKLKPTKHHPNSTISHTSLMPYCQPCPIGYYQSNYGQFFCRSCPEQYTTSAKRSTTVEQCIPTAKLICENYSNICNDGKCVADDDFYYSCNCGDNYIGSHCETRINSCLSNPCLNDGICAPTYNNQLNSYTCTCKTGFSGQNCEEVDEVCLAKCFNEGKCEKNEHDEETCLCPDDYGGDFCEVKLKYCEDNICENNGRCEEWPSSYRCICVNGFIGKRCSLLPCDYQPCPKNFICLNTNSTKTTRNSYICECPKGFEGPSCMDKINYCDNNPCVNGGICLTSEEDFLCKCQKLYFGSTCERKMNNDYILHFKRSGVTDYIKLDGFADNLTEISTCLWMATDDNFNYGTLISYATYDYDNAFTITDYTGLVLYINGQHVITDIFLNDGLWHYLCVTWRNVDGAYYIYVDGKLAQNGTGLATNTKIDGGGKMIIGQEQDVLGGRFSQSESFLGKISYLDVWKRVLNHPEIIANMNNCDESVFGDLYAWAEIKNNIYGDIKILNSTFCKTCTDRLKLEHGVIGVLNNKAYYKCNVGYQISTNLYETGRKCIKASTWEGNIEPLCRKIYCGYPGYIKYGKFVGRNYYFSAKVIYSCYAGYSLVGSVSQVCTENGTWYPERPECIGVRCKSFTKPDNSEISIITDSMENLDTRLYYDVGTQIDITCINDSKLRGQKLLTCLDNGTWNYPIPECVKEEKTSSILPCPIDQIPKEPINGYVVLETLTAYKNGTTDTVVFKCRYGYKLIGDSSTTCILDGYWTEMSISCNPIKCGKPPPVQNMKIKDEHLFNSTYQFGNMVTYECIEGYQIFGNGIIRCLANGRWTRIQARCNRKSCFKPVVKETTKIEGNSYLYQDEVTIICSGKTRYKIKCASNGQWIGERRNDC